MEEAFLCQNYTIRDFPGSPVVNNLPPMQGHRLDPWSRKIAYASGQLSLCTTSTEAQTPRAHVSQQKKPPQQGAFALQLETSCQSLQLKKALAKQQAPHSQK